MVGMGQGVVTKSGSGVGFFLAIMYIEPELWKDVTDIFPKIVNICYEIHQHHQS